MRIKRTRSAWKKFGSRRLCDRPFCHCWYLPPSMPKAFPLLLLMYSRCLIFFAPFKRTDVEQASVTQKHHDVSLPPRPYCLLSAWSNYGKNLRTCLCPGLRCFSCTLSACDRTAPRLSAAAPKTDSGSRKSERRGTRDVGPEFRNLGTTSTSFAGCLRADAPVLSAGSAFLGSG